MESAQGERKCEKNNGESEKLRVNVIGVFRTRSLKGRSYERTAKCNSIRQFTTPNAVRFVTQIAGTGQLGPIPEPRTPWEPRLFLNSALIRMSG
ncbi:hypothetical protein TNCV_2619111 [Trichonephila clavipes]|uniref:Uncharacterized protein n=1 Tax=Trichonephila clavipes TaxID=2585209 RepID=A0A8X6WIY9_TRICX|nr:hypothetical protein TNCV_2619111 [Trichonephila clavipes]